MEKVRPWCGQPSDRGRLKSRNRNPQKAHLWAITVLYLSVFVIVPEKSRGNKKCDEEEEEEL